MKKGVEYASACLIHLLLAPSRTSYGFAISADLTFQVFHKLACPIHYFNFYNQYLAVTSTGCVAACDNGIVNALNPCTPVIAALDIPPTLSIRLVDASCWTKCGNLIGRLQERWLIKAVRSFWHAGKWRDLWARVTCFPTNFTCSSSEPFRPTVLRHTSP